jgi:hypothetical protein
VLHRGMQSKSAQGSRVRWIKAPVSPSSDQASRLRNFFDARKGRWQSNCAAPRILFVCNTLQAKPLTKPKAQEKVVLDVSFARALSGTLLARCTIVARLPLHQYHLAPTLWSQEDIAFKAKQKAQQKVPALGPSARRMLTPIAGRCRYGRQNQKRQKINSRQE